MGRSDEATERRSDEGKELPGALRQPFIELVLSVADDKLVLGHRNSDWTGLAPILEEDIAFSALAQDEMSHAKALYELAAPLTGRSADQLAFGRRPEEYRCAALVEEPDNFDWAFAIARQFLCDHFDLLRLEHMGRSSYAPLALLARRLAAEERVHVEHADTWVIRLGRGTGESKARLEEAFRKVSVTGPSLLEPAPGQELLAAAGIYPDSPDLFESWSAALRRVAGEAGLALSLKRPPPGNRRGKHTEHLAPLLDEMCEVFRLEPEAAW
jgi:ring-1,2-phenylacetyl-CoA epoxidase subunit PaaC